MATFTFEGKSKAKQRKENIEWMNIWCENANDDSLPRVALIGDSITHQSFGVAQRELKGIAHIDLLSASYSITSEFYIRTLENFLRGSNYAVIHYNYGLHAYNVTDDEYEEAYRHLLKLFTKHGKVIIATTTTVLTLPDMAEEQEPSKTVVHNRNERALKLAKEFGLSVDDLFSVCQKLPKDAKQPDGVHFNELGNEALGKSIAESIKKALL